MAYSALDRCPSGPHGDCRPGPDRAAAGSKPPLTCGTYCSPITNRWQPVAGLLEFNPVNGATKRDLISTLS